ncbi:MAG: HIT family protein [Robiginitomaculum sp.]|nr:HIT family protein [Robiginitomaculum sp.]
MSLTGKYDQQNIFAKILRGEIPYAKVYEDEHILAFMDAFPQSPCHTLVIPKKPSRNLFDIEPQQLTAVITGVQKISAAVEKAFSPDGIIITQFNGEAAGQTVFHLHFHIIPKFPELTMQRHGRGQMAEMNVLLEQAEKISAAL